LLRHAVTPDEAGARVDVIVARLTTMSRSLVAGAIKNGTVRVNGDRVKASHVLEPGDLIDYEVAPREALAAHAESIPVPILYEDDDVIVVDKPAGMVTHPAGGAARGTLVNALLGHAGSLPGDPLRPGLVQRLDRDTSGLLVVAKTAEALEALGTAMRERRVHREYLGLVTGIPEHAKGTVEGPIGRDPRNRLKYAIVRDGKPAVTHYEVLQRFGNYAELRFTLETGRTHQIRVHLAAMGHPIVNDPVYGREEPRLGLPGQALHARRLVFEHPRTHERLEFEADPPPAYLHARSLLERAGNG
jgi:23S rRNA pseudouridine1911/1915/1917 synthase